MRRVAELPPRPSLPPTLGCALGLWASCAVVLAASEGWTAQACVAIAIGAALVSLAAAAALWRSQATQLWAALLGIALGIACAGGCAAWQHVASAEAEGVAGRLRFEAVEDGREGAFGASCVMRTALPNGHAILVQLRFDEDTPVPRYGDVVEAIASLSLPGGVAASSRWREGVVAEARARDVVFHERSDLAGAFLSARSRAIDGLERQGSDEGTAVLAALVCGWRGMLNGSDAYEAFKVTGLAHLVAVSGAHLSIVAAFAAALLRLLRLPRTAACVIEVVLLLAYLVFSGAPISAVRAAVMAFAGMFSFFARRRPAGLGALSICMIGCVALAPTTALSVSFALSALSTLGIVLFASLASAWASAFAPRLPRFVRDALALTLASSVLATPLSAALFSQIPLIAPIANVVAAPFFAPVCTVGLVACVLALVIPPVAGVLVGFASAGAGALSAFVCFLARIPYASVPADVPLEGALAASIALAAALWLAWPRPRVRVLAGLAVVSVLTAVLAIAVAPRLAGDEIVMLDVGQGDAFVIRSNGAAVLVDTGNQDRLLREALARHGVFHLDAVVVTHGDDDHMGSLASLSGVVQVDRVLVAEDALTCGCDSCAHLVSDARTLVGEDGVQGLLQGDVLQVGAFKLDVVWPAGFTDEGGNADSVCLLADADVDGDGASDWRTLFTGDAEHDQLRALIDAGLVDAIDVYKVGHHGSKNALDDEEAAVLKPRLALVSAGAGNRYGHPAPETLERLEAVGAEIRRTDEEGDVSCKFKPDRIEVSSLR